ncbi:hypothetical protein ADT28_09455 [Xylella fastidiosa]|nr:hypothetical protein OY18_08970 [Xylella fastidiosa]KXB19732.1 hypothetical protein ADT28_09455 [Xylella fastidiosa]NRP66867.1 hypothetical protein [Xylella fastidiosa]
MYLRSLTLAFVLLPIMASAQTISEANVAKVKLKIVESEDRFTGLKTITAKSCIHLNQSGMLTDLYLCPAIASKPNQPLVMYARGDYTGYGWAFLTGQAQFLIDGKQYSAQGTARPEEKRVATCSGNVGCINKETARFSMTEELATAIANARDAEVRFVGRQGSVTGRLNAKHVAYFREMLRRYKTLGGVFESASTANEGTLEVNTSESENKVKN